MLRKRYSRSQDGPLEMAITKKDQKKTALVLAGGGAKAIFQAQVVARLREAGYSFDLISGVSAGSLNAAILSQNDGGVVNLWSSVDKDQLFSGGPGLWRALLMALGIKKSIYDNDGLERFLAENYRPSNTEIPFIVGSVNLNTSEYNEFEITPDSRITSWRREEIYRSIIASSSIPVLFPSVSSLGSNEEHLFADGGLRNIAPLSSVIDRDVDEILVVTCSPRHLGTSSNDLNSPFDIAERSFNILLNEIVREDIDSVLKVNKILEKCEKEVRKADGRKYKHIDISLVEPRFGLGGLLDFSDSIQKKRIEEANNVCDRLLEKSATKSYTK